MIYIKRAYEKPDKKDGYRILVDRLWPRGVTKEKAEIDCWMKAIAPSKELRKWFNHEPEKFSDFKEKYKKELLNEPETVQELSAILKQEPIVTFVYSAKDETMNNAVVLKEIMEEVHRKK
ncbi:DUF488 domain-containing protein [Enterococcus sp. BWT-B8]|uniref:DUF488 domain-containing protein n=1 Tax=unclassified Enterococcus TaxID=2608891 RepID=UPI001E5464DC|nr:MULTISPECIES: DUF488 domain-containing protein [unclassified Enterococcus]MCB5952221.1 DUF488 domain-containing protein [Enterococcus sp. BWT-B8]MCB5956062.1 DUF488 domain-containing protein [Enterococcus sp. CWB-B31]